MATNKEIGEIVAMLGAAYPRFKASAQTVKTYSLMLKDIPAEALQAAALKCASECTFFPSVHELRGAVSEIRRDASGVPSDYEAWQEVVNRPKDGYNKQVKNEGGEYVIVKTAVPWSHPFVEKVAYMLGWPDFPTSREIGVDRAHFTKAYNEALAGSMRDSVQLPQVRAYIEGQSAQLRDLLPKGQDNGQ